VEAVLHAGKARAGERVRVQRSVRMACGGSSLYRISGDRTRDKLRGRPGNPVASCSIGNFDGLGSRHFAQ